MNIHAKIYELSESLGLKKIEDNHYRGIFIVTEDIVDDCKVHDYGCRFLFLDIRKGEEDIFFYIGSADDSDICEYTDTNLVQTDVKVGFQKQDYEKALEVLSIL